MSTFEKARRMPGGYAELHVADLHARLSDVTLVDVRELDEWTAGHVPQSRHLPLSSWPMAVASIPQGKPVVLLCHSGARSARAAMHLGQQGLTDVYNVSGGIVAWMAHKFPVER